MITNYIDVRARVPRYHGGLMHIVENMFTQTVIQLHDYNYIV